MPIEFLGDLFKFAYGQVRRYLEEYRFVFLARFALHFARCHDGIQQWSQAVARLKAAQARRVWRGDIDRQIIGVVIKNIQAQSVIGNAIG